MAVEKSPRRGRPRDQVARAKILAAANTLLNEGGLGAVTMEAIAGRAGVGKPTIYREWPNAQAVAMAAFLENTRPMAPIGRRGKALDMLRLHLRKVAETFATRAGRNTAMMIAAAQNDSELSKVFRSHFILKSREEGRAMLSLAIANKELRKDIDLDVALDLLYAPLYFRLLIGHGTLDAAFTDAVLDTVRDGLKTPALPRLRGA
jgi:AcrR family transcriptional regulator